MVTFFITSVFVLGLLAVAIYFWQKPANTSETSELPLPPPRPQNLFADFQPNELEPADEEQLQTPKDLDDNKEAFQQAIAEWQQASDRNSTAKMLHAAALSEDAEIYRRALETALRSWREGKLSDISAVELQSLFNGEFWVLSSAARSSGAGFVLKRTLANANRELEGTNN